MMSGMKKGDVKAVLNRVLTWPAEAQKEAVATLRAIEEEWMGGDCHPTAEKLKEIGGRWLAIDVQAHAV
jgi:hypothetical protein